MEYRNKLFGAFDKLGLKPSDRQINQFMLYIDLLLEWNEKINLTAITDREQIIIKHFADSVSLLSQIKLKDEHIIDIGAGAGFPSIPIKILCPDTKVTLVDSLAKRIKFLEVVRSELKLRDVECIHSRAEELIRQNDSLRERYDVCVSRAVANLSVLCELSIPYVKCGGYFVAYKGRECEGELEKAESAIKKLADKSDVFVKKIELPMSDITHSLIFIRKLSITPIKYPRIYAKISSKPL